jgi:cytoskeletal protein RodZ
MKISTSGAWDFKVAPTTPRYRSKPALVAVVVVAMLALLCLAFFVHSPAPTVDQPANVAPSEPTGQPAPSSPSPALSTQAPPPSPPPAPPPLPTPPLALEMSPPVPNRQYVPSDQTPDTPKKPQTNVTRAPMSATPPPPPQETDRGRATPGESGTHGFFG